MIKAAAEEEKRAEAEFPGDRVPGAPHFCFSLSQRIVFFPAAVPTGLVEANSPFFFMKVQKKAKLVTFLLWQSRRPERREILFHFLYVRLVP